MKKEFVPYEQALTLKELGFDEPCIARWIVTDIRDGGEVKLEIWNDEDTEYEVKSSTKAPLFQQAFTWFREKYNIEHNNRPAKKFDNDKSREISVFIDGVFISNLRFTGEYTHEEAELECLKKLIEIVKNENK